MSSELKISLDFRKTIAGLDRMGKKQFPFAAAKSLTQLAKLAQKGVRANTKKKFKLKATAFILRNIRITPAKKREIAMGRGYAAVRTDPKITQFMAGHEHGQTRKARQGLLAVPGADLKNRPYRKASGGIKKRFQPKNLLKDFKGSRGKRGPSMNTRRKLPFIIRGRGGTPMLVKRTTKRRRPLQILFNFAKKADIKQSWDFEKTVRGIVRNRYKPTFTQNLAAAIRSAR